MKTYAPVIKKKKDRKRPNIFYEEILKENSNLNKNVMKRTYYFTKEAFPSSLIMQKVINEESFMLNGADFAIHDVNKATNFVDDLIALVNSSKDTGRKLSSSFLEENLMQMSMITTNSLSGKQRDYQEKYFANGKNKNLKTALETQLKRIEKATAEIKRILNKEEVGIANAVDMNRQVAEKLLYEGN